MKLQKLGGYASIILICVIVVIRGISAKLGLPLRYTDVSPTELMTAFETYPIFIRIARLTSFLAAIYLVLITLVLKERMQSDAKNLMSFAIIAASIASTLELTGGTILVSSMEAMTAAKEILSYTLLVGIMEGISYAKGYAWGFALLLTGIAAVKTLVLPKILSYIILIYGICHIITFYVKPAGIVGMLFPIIFLWLGIYLLWKPEPDIG